MVGGPYRSPNAGLGGLPTRNIDIPICAVFILLFTIAAASHLIILRRNLARGHRFLFSGMMGGFCITRVVTCVVRIAWATHRTNIRLGIAANIFFSAGILIVYILNLIFAQRMLCASVPSAKLNMILKRGGAIFFGVIFLTLALLITVIIQSFYTLDTNIRQIDRDVQLAAGTFFLVLAALPSFIVPIAHLLRKEDTSKPLGTGAWKAQFALLMTTTVLATAIAGFRCGTSWMPPRPLLRPAWFDAKWCYYVFSFTLEILIVYTYLFARFDRHFHVAADVAEGDVEKISHPQCYAIDVEGVWRPTDVRGAERILAVNESSTSLESSDSRK